MARATSVPARTHKDTKYCLGLLEAWKEWRQTENYDVIESIEKLSKSKMYFRLSRFVLEVTNFFFKHYPKILPIIFVYRFEKKMCLNLHQTLCITCGLMRHLRGNSHPAIAFFGDPEFCKFRSSLDAEMKRLQSSGNVSNKRQAEPLTPENEELLWEKGLLGHSTPQALLDTMIFYNGIHFAIRSKDEHRQLHFNSNQYKTC